MPSNLQTAFLGFLTLRILNGIPQDQAGWIIKALTRWILEKTEPEASEIPPECLGSWIAIREESVSIADRKKELAAFGRSGGRPASKPTENAPEKAPDESQGKPTQSQGKPTQSQGKQDEDEDEDNTSGKPDASMQPPRGCVGHRTSEKTVSGFPSAEDPDALKDVSFLAWAATLRDPVDAALDTTGEPPRGLHRRTYGKRLKALGRDRFLEEIAQFRAELDAGEQVRNRGAALTHRLDERVEAMTALQNL